MEEIRLLFDFTKCRVATPLHQRDAVILHALKQLNDLLGQSGVQVRSITPLNADESLANNNQLADSINHSNAAIPTAAP